MTKETALEIIKSAFCHMFIESDVEVSSVPILLYFPTMDIVVVDTTDEKRAILDDPNIEDMDSLLIKRELGAETVYLDIKEENFNIGLVINDILMAAEFAPAESFLTNKDVKH